MGVDEERVAYLTEQDMLPFDEKDCIFCVGEGCSACSMTGKLNRVMTQEAHERGRENLIREGRWIDSDES